MQVKITFQGARDSKEWNHFAWLVNINGVDFEYRTGLGHATPKVNKFGDRAWHKPAIPTVSIENAWVHIPGIDGVLECLFSDARCGAESFDDFCDNCGYSNDSLKALDTYRACMESAKNLRKALGAAYETERARIESLNQ